jgi:hypothetical protein
MRRLTRVTMAAAAGGALALGLAVGPASAAEGWDINTGWVEVPVEDEVGPVGATCDFDGDGEAAYYEVVPGQTTTVRLLVRFVYDDPTVSNERVVMMWRVFDGLQFESSAGASPESFTVDARLLTRGHAVGSSADGETGTVSTVGHGVFTAADGTTLYRGVWAESAVLENSVPVEYTLTGPCSLDVE